MLFIGIADVCNWDYSLLVPLSWSVKIVLVFSLAWKLSGHLRRNPEYLKRCQIEARAGSWQKLMIPLNVGQQDYQTLYHQTRLVSNFPMTTPDSYEHECYLLDATNETVLKSSVPPRFESDPRFYTYCIEYTYQCMLLVQVSRLIYTNAGIALLALASNAVHKLWKWQRSERNPSGKVSNISSTVKYSKIMSVILSWSQQIYSQNALHVNSTELLWQFLQTLVEVF